MFSDFVRCRMALLFYGWPGDFPAEPFVPLCPDAAGGISCVLYFLCAAIWLYDLLAVILMMIFGAAHLTVSIQSFR